MIGDDKRRKGAINDILGYPAEEKTELPEKGALHSIAEELVSSVHSKNIEAVADCLRAAFSQLESEENEEGE